MGLGRYVTRNLTLCSDFDLDLFISPILVQEDADFECMSVLMEHSQDVKAVAWHPKEEVLPAHNL